MRNSTRRHLNPAPDEYCKLRQENWTSVINIDDVNIAYDSFMYTFIAVNLKNGFVSIVNIFILNFSAISCPEISQKMQPQKSVDKRTALVVGCMLTNKRLLRSGT